MALAGVHVCWLRVLVLCVLVCGRVGPVADRGFVSVYRAGLLMCCVVLRVIANTRVIFDISASWIATAHALFHTPLRTKSELVHICRSGNSILSL